MILPDSLPLALLVDLDGTLVDTAGANAAAYAAALAQAGIAVDEALLRRVASGRHWTQFLPQLLDDAGRADVDPATVAAAKARLYPAMLTGLPVNLGLVALIRLCRAARLRTALVTTASRSNAQAVLSAAGLAELFDLTVSGDDVDNRKPAPDAYRLAAARLGVPEALCLAVEDSDIGVASARAAGMAVMMTQIETERAR